MAQLFSLGHITLMEKIFILSGLVVLAFFAGRFLDRLRRRPDAMLPNLLLAVLALAFAVWMVVRGFMIGWTTPTIIFATLGLLNLVARLRVIRRQQQSVKQ